MTQQTHCWWPTGKKKLTMIWVWTTILFNASDFGPVHNWHYSQHIDVSLKFHRMPYFISISECSNRFLVYLKDCFNSIVKVNSWFKLLSLVSVHVSHEHVKWEAWLSSNRIGRWWWTTLSRLFLFSLLSTFSFSLPFLMTGFLCEHVSAWSPESPYEVQA